MANVEFLDLSPEIKEDLRGASFFPWPRGVKDPRDLLRTFHLFPSIRGRPGASICTPASKNGSTCFTSRESLSGKRPPGWWQSG